MVPVKLLIADAQRLLADALAVSLEYTGGFEVSHRHPVRGGDVIEAATELQPDVALIDYWLDGLTGPEVIRGVLDRSPGTRIISLSGFHGPAQINESLEAGAVGFLPKGLEVDAIRKAVVRAHMGEQPILDASATRSETWGPASELALSPRELEVLRLVAAGRDVREIAARLNISQATVRTHIQRSLEKTGSRSRMAAVAVARLHGLVP